MPSHRTNTPNTHKKSPVLRVGVRTGLEASPGVGIGLARVRSEVGIGANPKVCRFQVSGWEPGTVAGRAMRIVRRYAKPRSGSGCCNKGIKGRGRANARPLLYAT